MRVAVVGSPPYSATQNQGGDQATAPGMKWAHGERTDRGVVNPSNFRGRNYGTTPGQLGALPPGALDASPVPTTTAPVTTWQGCYADGWQDLIVPDAFAHPAKFARGLIHRIYRHLLEQGYVREGDTVLDPFGGVGLGALDAMTYGLTWIGCELEPRFTVLGEQNLALWRQRYGFTGGTVVQGDSRWLREVLAGRRLAIGGTLPGVINAAIVSSPPYVGSIHDGNGIDHAKLAGHMPGPHTQTKAEGYGTTLGQLGAMPPGAVVGSPPYAESLNSAQHGIKDERRSRDSADIQQACYGTSPGQLGNTTGDTFWAASSQIMTELRALLPPGAVCAWVLKAYVSKGKIVPFPDQWRALCEAHGFQLVEEIHASLVEDCGTQEGLFGEADVVQIARKSFFRRLAEKKGSPRIDYETVLIMRKAGDTGGVCVVSSPPFQDFTASDNGFRPPHSSAEHGRDEAAPSSLQMADMTRYGTTPGNLGNMPVERRS